MGTYYSDHNQASLAAENYTKAFDLRDRVSDRERYYIETVYYQFVTGEQDKAVQTFLEWTHAYPNDDTAHNNLGVAYSTIGQFEKAAEETRETIRLAPTVVGYGNLIGTYLALNRFDEAKQAFDSDCCQAGWCRPSSPALLPGIHSGRQRGHGRAGTVAGGKAWSRRCAALHAIGHERLLRTDGEGARNDASRDGIREGCRRSRDGGDLGRECRDA